MPTTTPEFWSRVAPRYAARPVRDEAAYATTLARARPYIGSTDRVLEIGCGTGTTAIKLADAAAHITASDIAPGMIEIAKRRIAEAGAPNVTAVTGSPGDPSLGHGPYEVVMAFNLLHLLPDLDAALARIAQLLPPGGHFISKTPCLAGMPWLRPAIGAMRLVGKAPWVAYLAPDAVEAAIRHAGFDIVETGAYPPRPPSHFVVARRK